MRKLVFLITLMFVWGSSSAFAQVNICADNGLKGRLSKSCNTLCESTECDVYNQTMATTENCIDAFDQYFKKSKGELAPCISRIPQPPEVEVPTNELWCYANWKADALACDVLFNPALDRYMIIEESDGTTQYEICLMNKQSMMDVCALSLNLRCNSNACWHPLTKPCYDEYEITHDDEALAACIDEVQPQIDYCIEENCYSYFYDIPNNF